MIIFIAASMTVIFVIGYMVGLDRGYRKAHERFTAAAAEEIRRKRRTRYTSKTKKLHLVKDSSDTRE